MAKLRASRNIAAPPRRAGGRGMPTRNSGVARARDASFPRREMIGMPANGRRRPIGEMSCLRMSCFDGFAGRAKFYISRPQLFLLILALSGMPGCGGGSSGIGPITIGSGKVQGFAGAAATVA